MSCQSFHTIPIDMTLKCQVLNMHNGLTNGKAHMYLDKQIPIDMNTIVSLDIQSGLARRAERSLFRIMFIVIQ